ncbi:MAG: O-antigen ligase family protein [Clostridiales bacterium]|jgi:O-antigen ligase|nr:O-antigen ligase family protein [Clostridiales bacterium]
MIRLTVNRKLIAFLMLAAPFFLPTYVGLAYLRFDAIVNIWKALSLAGIILIYCLRNSFISKPTLRLLIFHVTILFSTALNGGDIKTVIFQTAYAMAICMLVDHIFSYRPLQGIELFMRVMELLIYSNLVAMLAYPLGLYHTTYIGPVLGGLMTDSSSDRVGWLLGHQSLAGCYSIVAIFIASLYSDMRNDSSKLREVSLITASIVHGILSGSAMNKIIIIVIVVMIIYVKIKGNFIKIGVKALTGFCFIVTVAFMKLKIPDGISAFIASAFNRSANLSGRTGIWNLIAEKLSLKPIFGYGLQYDNVSIIKNTATAITHAHNQYLDILFRGGIVAFIAFVIYMSAINKSVRECYKMKVCRIPICCLYCLFALMITDVYFLRHPIIFLTLALSAKLGDIGAGFVTPASALGKNQA